MLSAMVLTPVAYAIPNMWTSGFGMGVSEYIITSKNNTVVNLTCTTNPDDDAVLQHRLYLTLPDGTMLDSGDEKTAITLVTGDVAYPIPASLGWRNGDNAWVDFIHAIRQATEFDVYVNDKKIGHFQPSRKNTQKELGDLADCLKINDEG
ncbi:hypothetical protein A9798_15485 [Edwardsiella hoshinae]|uniref:Uncharacterized protein n=2 Tax=Edwardsiella hoshinae TaxID=93378 RepID=A0ABN4T2Z1_9GAMM|nr:hypothetical protein A9798_15485 [Edwardsiella hoshinae]